MKIDEPFIFALRGDQNLLSLFDHASEIDFSDVENVVLRDTRNTPHFFAAYPRSLKVGPPFLNETDFMPNLVNFQLGGDPDEAVEGESENESELGDDSEVLKTLLLAQTESIFGARPRGPCLERAHTVTEDEVCPCSGRGVSRAYHQLFPFIYMLKSGLPGVKLNVNTKTVLLTRDMASALKSVKTMVDKTCPLHEKNIREFTDALNFDGPINIISLHQYLGFLIGSEILEISGKQTLDLTKLSKMQFWRRLFLPSTFCSLAAFSIHIEINLLNKDFVPSDGYEKCPALFYAPTTTKLSNNEPAVHETTFYDDFKVCPKIMANSL